MYWVIFINVYYFNLYLYFTFITLGDETINSSLVERGRLLMDPLPHPLLHFLVRMKPTSTNVFLQVTKNAGVTRGKTYAVRRMLKCFPAKSLKLIPYQIVSMGTGVIMQKDDPFRHHSRAFWLYRVFQHPQPPRNERHLSALLCMPPFSMMDEHTVYATLASRAIKKQLCGPVRFHYAYLCSLWYRTWTLQRP